MAGRQASWPRACVCVWGGCDSLSGFEYGPPNTVSAPWRVRLRVSFFESEREKIDTTLCKVGRSTRRCTLFLSLAPNAPCGPLRLQQRLAPACMGKSEPPAPPPPPLPCPKCMRDAAAAAVLAPSASLPFFVAPPGPWSACLPACMPRPPLRCMT